MISANVSAQLEQSDVKGAIAKAVHYLNNIPDSTFSSYNQRLLFAYIAKKYAIAEQPRKNLLKYKNISDEDIPVKSFYMRILKEQAFDTVELRKYYERAQDIPRLLIWGIYSDILPLDSATMNAFINARDVRGIAHASLALYWAESRLTQEQKQMLFDLYKAYRSSLIQNVIRAGIVTDSGLEGMVTFLFLHSNNTMPISWLGKILQHQNVDGGWNFDGQLGQASNPHTTLLALWILSGFDR